MLPRPLFLLACLAAVAALVPQGRFAAVGPKRARPQARALEAVPFGQMLFTLADEEVASGLPDPNMAVGFFVVLLVAYAVTQLEMVGVVQEEDAMGAEPGRQARDAMARRRGYFRNKN
ncbi:hypothetical protein M885DRAFT_533225 [Pelagophyceae sp. CCMP2097]|nr:hypothetical protein M885DRAFT_533225 [Pelagophyceae sp. CCMP2097]